LPCKSGKTTSCIFPPHFDSRTPNASAKICYALSTLKATIVLPDFARSCSADKENEKSIASKMNLNKKMSIGLTEKRAGCMAGMTV
jgi:hypothetical protein